MHMYIHVNVYMYMYCTSYTINIKHIYNNYNTCTCTYMYMYCTSYTILKLEYKTCASITSAIGT